MNLIHSERFRLRHELRKGRRDHVLDAASRLARTVPDLSRELKRLVLDGDEDEDVRYAALELLGAWQDPESIPVLLLALSELGTLYVGEALGLYVDSVPSPFGAELVEHGLRWLLSPHHTERQAGVLAFTRVRDTRCVKPIVTLLADRNAEVRCAACFALALQRASSALPAIVGTLARDRDVHVRRSAAEALGILGDPRAADGLAAAMRHDLHPTVRLSAIRGLERLPGEHVDDLLLSAPANLAEEVDSALSWRWRYPAMLTRDASGVPEHPWLHVVSD